MPLELKFRVLAIMIIFSLAPKGTRVITVFEVHFKRYRFYRLLQRKLLDKESRQPNLKKKLNTTGKMKIALSQHLRNKDPSVEDLEFVHW